MEKIFALVVIVLVVGVSGKAQNFQANQTTPDNGKFLCHNCQLFVSFVHNMTTDKAFLASVVKFTQQMFWGHMVPPDFVKYCMDTCDAIPGLMEDFAEEYLDPSKDCALVCSGPQPELLNNGIQNLAMKLGGDTK